MIGAPVKIAEPVITAEDRDAVAGALESGWVSGLSPVVEQFEAGFAGVAGSSFGIAVPSGTIALHLALVALGIGPGDEVIVPTFCMIAAYHAIVQTGATPVLCDSLADTWNLDPAAVEAAITARTRAIVPVHIYGLPCDMDELISLAAAAGAAIVEDAAEAHGAEYRGRRAGSLGAVGCFSFYSNKIITCGEGGMVTTSDAELAERLRSLRELGRVAGERYVYHGTGFGYRMPAASAALGLSQLSRFESLAARRVRNADLYREHLADTPGLTFAPRLDDRTGSDWMVGVMVGDEFGASREELAAHLWDADVETRPFFVPVHRQPFYSGVADFPVAEQLGRHGLLLPSGGNLSDYDVERVSVLVKEASHD
jgi:perosamine synthetase